MLPYLKTRSGRNEQIMQANGRQDKLAHHYCSHGGTVQLSGHYPGQRLDLQAIAGSGKDVRPIAAVSYWHRRRKMWKLLIEKLVAYLVIAPRRSLFSCHLELRSRFWGGNYPGTCPSRRRESLLNFLDKLSIRSIL